MEKELLDFDAEPFTPNIPHGQLLCPQCNCEPLNIENIGLNLADATNLTIEPDNTIRRGIVKIKLAKDENFSDESYGITLWYRCKRGHRGTIEFQHAMGNTFVVHRPFSVKNVQPNK